MEDHVIVLERQLVVSVAKNRIEHLTAAEAIRLEEIIQWHTIELTIALRQECDKTMLARVRPPLPSADSPFQR